MYSRSTIKTEDEAYFREFLTAAREAATQREVRDAAGALGTVEMVDHPGFAASGVEDLTLIKGAMQASSRVDALVNAVVDLDEGGDGDVRAPVAVAATSWTWRAFGVGAEDEELGALVALQAAAPAADEAHANDARGVGVDLDFGMLERETPIDIEIDGVGIPVVPLATIEALDKSAVVKAVLARARIAQLRAARAPVDDSAPRPCTVCGASFDKRRLMDHVLDSYRCFATIFDDDKGENRRLKNRLAAARSRFRREAELEALKQDVEAREGRVASLRASVASLTVANAGLRARLAGDAAAAPAAEELLDGRAAPSAGAQ